MAPELQPVLLTEFAVAPGKAPTVRGHRSKGCITCRNRKVKCDERRPTCSRCEKGKHKCLGYDKPLVFVAQEFGAQKATTSPVLASSTSKKRATTPSTLHSASSPSTLASDDDWAFVLPKKKALSPARQVCRTVPLNAFKDEIVICHLLERFSIGLGPSMMGAADAPTMTGVLMSQDAKSNAYISGLGLAEAFFGRVQKVHGMVDHSAELYGQAMRSLRDDLQIVDRSAARARAYMNLWTCVFLGLYEMVSTSGSSNWMQHSRGFGALTQLLGPEAFQSVVAKSILEMNRSTIAIAHIVDRKHCFLEQPEWQSVPWQNDPEPRSINSQTVDILCDAPGLMEDIDAMNKKESQGIDVTQERFLVQDKLLHRVQRIGDLVWQWDLLNPLACWEMPTNLGTSVSVDEIGQPLFGSVLHYQDVDKACDVAYLNAVRLLLYAMCDEAKLPEVYVQAVVGSQQAGPHANPLLLPGQGDRIAHSLEICRTVDFMMASAKESRGALVMLFPLRVAWGHLRDVPEMAAWVGRVMLQLSSTKGLKIGEHVLQIDSVTQE